MDSINRWYERQSITNLKNLCEQYETFQQQYETFQQQYETIQQQYELVKSRHWDERIENDKRIRSMEAAHAGALTAINVELQREV